MKMSNCKIDHSHEDVQKKYQSQIEFLPNEMTPMFESFFSKEHAQIILNEMFHLLKKYDLSSEQEKDQRNKQILLLLNKN